MGWDEHLSLFLPALQLETYVRVGCPPPRAHTHTHTCPMSRRVYKNKQKLVPAVISSGYYWLLAPGQGSGSGWDPADHHLLQRHRGHMPSTSTSLWNGSVRLGNWSNCSGDIAGNRVTTGCSACCISWCSCVCKSIHELEKLSTQYRTQANSTPGHAAE